jgi:RNA polymerase sigma factor for flagellar operon FliA
MTEDSRQKLIADHMEMAAAIAADCATRFNLFALLPYDDVLGYAQQGLVEAANRYSPDSGTSFRTFSWTRIKGAVIDGVRKHRRDGYTRSRGAPEHRHEGPTPGRPSASDVEALTDEESIFDPPEARLDRQRLRASLLKAIDALPPRQREVTLRHYYRDEELITISKDQGLSHDYVSRVHTSSLRQLRTSLAGDLRGHLATEASQ